jgi:Secretion system C-terminal sorting domain
VEITQTLDAPLSVNPGNLGAIITSAQNFGSTVIRRGHQVQTIGNQLTVKRYFDIIPANNLSLNATLRFIYFDSEMNGFDENSVVIWKSQDNINWNEMGFDSRSTTTNYIEKTGIADFSRWTLSSATQVNNKIVLLKTIAGKLVNEKVETGKFNVKVIPNPSPDYFTLQIESSKKEISVVKVFDVSGRLVKQMKAAVFESLQFGSDLKTGIYLVEVVQDKNRKTLKLIKF